ncbi:MAG: hypothetical protein IAE80_14595 [Anaerolinea sp.]|nr:hypothetical protein [Anaerolinea sp.]
MSAIPNEPTPEFNARCGAVLDAWESGSLPFKDAIEQMTALGQEASRRGSLPDQGRVELLQGIMQGYRANLDASIRHFERARDFFERAGNRRRAIGALLNLGESFRVKGNFTRARTYFRAAYDGSKELGAVETMAIAAYNEGLMLISMTHFDGAKTLLDKALSLLGQFPDDRIDQRIELTCEVQASLAELHLKLNHPDEAWQYVLAAHNLAHELRQPLQLGSAHRALGQVVTMLHDVPEGTYPAISADPDEHFRLATEAFQEIKAEGEVARTMYLHALSLADRNRGMTAARKLQQAMIIFTRLGMADDAAKAAHAQMEVLANTTQQIG